MYFKKAQQKIDELKTKLKTAKQDGIPVKEREKMRNQISAQTSRMRKKEEVMYFNKAVRDKD